MKSLNRGTEAEVQKPAQPLEQELGRAAESEADNPLVMIARQMREAGTRIGQSDSGAQTQELQGRIVAQLDELLKQARKQCSSSQSPRPKQPDQARRDPIVQPKKPGNPAGEQAAKQPSEGKPEAKSNDLRRPDMKEMLSLMKRLWGELPEREREQMLQLAPEEFLESYRTMIEDYFQRLTEEKGETGH